MGGLNGLVGPYPVLGFAGFLQFFTATFRGDLEEVELIVNRLCAALRNGRNRIAEWILKGRIGTTWPKILTITRSPTA